MLLIGQGYTFELKDLFFYSPNQIFIRVLLYPKYVNN
jgi:hypothetical protein